MQYAPTTNYMKRYYLILLFFFLFAAPAFANNLVISNVTIEDRNPSANTMVVQFNISWDHSWRKPDGRHDAAWVFVKLYQNSTAPWIHGKLYTAGTNPTGTSSGTNSDLKIVVPSDKIGAFISRTATGNGTFSSQNVRLVVDYGTSGLADTDTVTAKVFGVEMAYIPEGPFYIGDGNGTSESLYALHENGVDNTSVQITTSAKSITADTNSCDDIDTSPVSVDGDGGITGNASWPTGYRAFYAMKYEISHGQYRDFLNSLSRTQQGHRVESVISANTIPNYYVMYGGPTQAIRQSIRAPASGNGTTNPVVFGCDLNDNGTFDEQDDGQGVAMNFINWMDMSAYADWAGLRHMTELEYEKACRGPQSAVYGEYAWGTSVTTAVSAISNAGRSSEVATNSGEGLANYSGGPLRVGSAATNATNRVSAAASYYGLMDMSGNLFEALVPLSNSVSRVFLGTHGDGTLTTTASYEGNATNNDWIGIDGTTARGITGDGPTVGTHRADFRGGDFSGGYQTSFRINVGCIGLQLKNRNSNNGVRFTRTAP